MTTTTTSFFFCFLGKHKRLEHKNNQANNSNSADLNLGTKEPEPQGNSRDAVVPVPVRTYDQFLQYLQQKDARIQIDTLPFDGKNRVLYCKLLTQQKILNEQAQTEK